MSGCAAPLPSPACDPWPGNTNAKGFIVRLSLWLSDRETEGLAVIPEHVANIVICENLQQLHAPRTDGDRLACWIDQARAAWMTVILTADCLPSRPDCRGNL